LGRLLLGRLLLGRLLLGRLLGRLGFWLSRLLLLLLRHFVDGLPDLLELGLQIIKTGVA
jgi:hypothetical protein